MDSGRLPMDDLVSALQHGLQECTRHHDNKCQVTPIVERSPERITDWVIDCSEYCIVPGETVAKYAALSYVWNPPNTGNQTSAERMMLQRENLGKLRMSGYLHEVAESLPMVVRDSIDFVQRSSVRYLWVDCLCIIQHDETTSDGVKKMKGIYSGAYFTIIAAASSPRLYGSRTDTTRIINTKGVPDAGSLHGALLTSHWATRGWTFQEQLLSKRSFIFLDETEFWDCQGAIWLSKSLTNSQGGFNNINLVIEKEPTANRKLSQDLATVSMPNFRLYMELICRYNHRDLTYTQDALPAISGVLDTLTNSFSSGFISGLPADFFDLALLWQPFTTAKRRICSGKKQRSSPPLPSWSWVGWQCRIDPANLRKYSSCEVRSDNRYPVTPHWRRTWKLADWIGSTDEGDECKIRDDPGILEQYNGARDPIDYSTKTTYKAEQGTGYTFQGPETSRYSHESNPESVFHAPKIFGCQRYKAFLSCTTSTARFKIRRIIFPHKGVPAQRRRYRASLNISVLDTPFYQDEPDFDACCPVVILEDNEGRWAGLLKMMENDPNINVQQEVEVAAISQGSSSYINAALTYEERVDRMVSECYQRMEEEADRMDLGPSFLHDMDCRDYEMALPNKWKTEVYDFYNVLWIKERGGVMERKAIGRVRKHIWDESHKTEQTIRLG
ncbi:hypothetical protein M426DRAFT_56689 [Hypoxylon sp. CI-4A]|nr:hypothetical protein M426DRAFT_56689 [Hypoxylon sp. CI-4A]